MKRIFILFFSFALIVFPVIAHGEETALPSAETEISDSSIIIEVVDVNQPLPDAVTEETIQNEMVEETVAETVVEEEVPTSDSTNPASEEVLDIPSETSSESLVEDVEGESSVELVQSFSLAVAAVQTLPSYCGDINQDLVVDSIDLDLAQNYIFEGGEPIDGANYDLNNDGVPDVLDIVTLVNYTRRHQLPEECVLNTSNGNESPSFGNFNPPTSTFVGDVYSYDVEATDPEGDPLEFSLLAGPDGMMISSSTGEISWTPDAFDATSTPHLITVQVSDGENNLSASFDLYVFLKSGAFICGDLNGDTLINQLDIDLMSGIAFENVVPHPLAKPDLNGDGVWNAIDVVIIINHVNRGGAAPTCGDGAPSFNGFNPPTNATATETYSYDAEASDPEGDPLVFSVVSGPVGLTINSSTGMISWTPTEDQATSTPYSVTIRVSDGTSNTDAVFQITVAPKPTPPGDGGGNNGGGGGGSGSGGGSVNVPAGSGGGALLSGGTSGNLPPYFVNFNPPAAITAGMAYIYDAEAIDPEGQTLSFKLLAGPAGMSIINFNGLILWVPAASQVSGTAHQATIEVSDGINATSTSFQVVVNAPAPVVSVTPVPSSGGGEEIIPPSNIEPVGEPEPSEVPPPVANEDEGDQGFAAALFAGILDFFGRLGDWILAHPFWSLLILLGLLLFWFILFKRRKDDEEEKKDVAVETGAVFQSSSEAAPTIITMPMSSSPSESNESNYS